MNIYYCFVEILREIKRSIIRFNAIHKMKIEYAAKNIKINIGNDYIIDNIVLEGDNYLFGNGRIANSTIGRYTYTQYNVNIAHAVIGRYCSIGPNTLIAQGEHPLNFLSTHPSFFKGFNPWVNDQSNLLDCSWHKTVQIGHDVWIGANCYIKDGVTIGTGAVIGTGSVVTKDIPPYAVAAGVPAKIIRYRFNEDKIHDLLASKWWEMSHSEVIDNYFRFDEA